jgi:hypothetical protein
MAKSTKQMSDTNARREAHERVIPYNGHNNDPVGTLDRWEQAEYWDFMERHNPAEDAYYKAHPEHPANQVMTFSDKPF